MTGNRLRRAAIAGALLATLASRGLAEAPRLATDTADLLDSDFADTRLATAKPNRIEISPTVQLAYDSNVFQLNPDRVAGSVDDWIATPGVALQVTHSFGRNSIDLTADAGYDFHRTHTELDQVRVNIKGSGHAAIGGFCAADPTAAVRIQQNNAAQLDTAKNSQTVQDYAITLACQRPAGFYPSVTLSRETVDNADPLRSLVDQKSQGVQGGVGYALPTLGSLLIEYGRQWIRQPNRDDDPDTSTGSDVTRYAATFTRAVAPRLSFQLGGSYLQVSPRGGGLRDYASGGYDITVDYHPTPRYALIATATRGVEGSGDVAVSYVIDSRYGLRGVARFSSKASLALSGEYADLIFRGEDPILYPIPRGREHQTTVSGNFRYDLGQLIRLGAFASYSIVDADGSLYDYDRVTGGLSVAARF